MKKGKSDKDLYRIPKKIDNSKNYCKLIIVIVMSVVFIGGQIVGGVVSHSISVISDATHLITDLVGFVVSFIFLYYSDKASNTKNSFGFHRMEVIGALANLFIIWCIAVFLFYEATVRIINKEFVEDPKVMLIVAGAGLGVNIIMYFVLHTGSGHSHGLGQKCQHDESSAAEETPLCKSCNEPQDKSHNCKNLNELLNDQAPARGRKIANDQQPSQIGLKDRQEIVQLSQLKKKGVLPPLKNISGNHSHGHSHSAEHGDEHHHDHSDPNHKCTGNHAHEHDHEPKKEGFAHKHDDGSECTGHHHGNDRKVSGDSCGSGHDHGHDHDHGHGHGHNHHHDHDHGDQIDENQQSISMKAAILHAFTDVIQSIGLLIAALVIYFVGSDNGAPVTEFNSWHYLDPVTTYVFSVLVIISTWPITKQCYQIILEATPEQIDSEKLNEEFNGVAGVKEIHDFHVWQLRPTKMLLTAHVFSEKGLEKKVLHSLTTICRRYKIYHTTIQVEEWEHKGSDEYVRCENDIH